MANDLASLLLAVERWQQFEHEQPPFGDEPYDTLRGFDCSAVRAAAHQHAEALRAIALAGDKFTEGDTDQTALRAAADFLDPGAR